MIYLGLDLGSKTLGVAFSSSGIIAMNLETYRFSEDDYDSAIAYTVNKINELKVDVVVLGLPKHMNNDLGIRGEISVSFKEKLSSKTNAKIILYDERLSTKTARLVLSNQNKKKDKQKKLKDEIAAVVILQAYLDSIN
ncbi:Holliday junction resolvase RuvX [Acholeplasma sp. OttesenSCG-928-E16]|nr:Holliday junction resolvase RuvX [Acholeplasma sp. OttesenSCG-928-E16]